MTLSHSCADGALFAPRHCLLVVLRGRRLVETTVWISQWRAVPKRLGRDGWGWQALQDLRQWKPAVPIPMLLPTSGFLADQFPLTLFVVPQSKGPTPCLSLTSTARECHQNTGTPRGKGILEAHRRFRCAPGIGMSSCGCGLDYSRVSLNLH